MINNESYKRSEWFFDQACMSNKRTEWSSEHDARQKDLFFVSTDASVTIFLKLNLFTVKWCEHLVKVKKQ